MVQDESCNLTKSNWRFNYAENQLATFVIGVLFGNFEYSSDLPFQVFVFNEIVAVDMIVNNLVRQSLIQKVLNQRTNLDQRIVIVLDLLS